MADLKKNDPYSACCIVSSEYWLLLGPDHRVKCSE